MKSLNQIVQLLRKPFPEGENKLYRHKYTIILSVFVAFFLYIFEPFGISTLESNQFFICLGFGAMTFLGALVYDLTVGSLVRSLRKGKTWTFGDWILTNLGIMLFISMANFLFARMVLFGFIDWELFPAMLYGTFMVGIIPIVGLGAILLLSQEKKYQDIAEEINQKTHYPSSIEATGNLSIFDIPTNKIKYIEALQNYVKIGYLTPEGTLKELTERATLKGILEQLGGSSIVKCHRSFLVNRDAIISTAGNAQGLLLTLSNCEKVIPVSRNWVSVFRES